MSAAGLWDVYTKDEIDDLFAKWFNKFHQDLIEHGEIEKKDFEYPIPSIEDKKGSLERGRENIAEIWKRLEEKEKEGGGKTD